MKNSQTRRVLVTDFLTGAITLGAGLVGGGRQIASLLPEIVVAFCVLMAAGLAISEHGAIPGLYPEVTALVTLVGTVAAAWAAMELYPQPTGTVLSAILVGSGVGIVGYRIVFGIVRPVPPARLSN